MKKVIGCSVECKQSSLVTVGPLSLIHILFVSSEKVPTKERSLSCLAQIHYNCTRSHMAPKTAESLLSRTLAVLRIQLKLKHPINIHIFRKDAPSSDQTGVMVFENGCGVLANFGE